MSDVLVPPTLFILLSVTAVWLALWHPRFGISLAIVTTSLLFLAALPVIAVWMLEDIEVKPPDNADFATAQAIVVLGGGTRHGDGDKVADTLGPWSLERLDFAAQAYHRLRLRVAVSGGRPSGAHIAEAALMKTVLEDDFNVPVTWVEDQSRTTYENALFTKHLLQADNVANVVLVTDAWHIRRALWSFERVGLHAIAWPAPPSVDEADRLDDYLPSIRALTDSYHALHEAIGLAYYRLRY